VLPICLYDGAVYPLGEWFGGSGFNAAALADFIRTECMNCTLLSPGVPAYTVPSVGYFDPADKRGYSIRAVSFFDSDCMLTGNAEK
jgi:hypothetical protein